MISFKSNFSCNDIIPFCVRYIAEDKTISENIWSCNAKSWPQNIKNNMESEVEALIDWCLTSTLAIFQLYRGEKKFYYNLELKLGNLTTMYYKRYEIYIQY